MLCRDGRWYLMIVVFSFAFSGGCNGPAEPNPATANLILLGLESGRLLLLDSRTPAAVAEVGPRAYPVHGPVVTRDGNLLFFSGKYPDESWKLVAVDLNKRQVLWTLDQARPDGTIPTYGGVQLIPASDGLAPSNDGTSLYVHPAVQAGVKGIAVFDVDRREVQGFWGPLLSTGMIVLSGSSAGVDTLVVIGTRSSDQGRARDSAYVIRTGLPFEVVLVIPPPPGSAQVWSVAKATGKAFYVAGDQTIGVYDLVMNAYVVVRSRQGFGPAVPSPDGLAVVLSDPGDPPVSPTGLLPILGADLQPLITVDLRPLSTVGVPPATWYVAFSHTTTELFVTAGSTHVRQDFTPEPGRLLILDRQTGLVRGTLDLQDWGHAWVFTLP